MTIKGINEKIANKIISYIKNAIFINFLTISRIAIGILIFLLLAIDNLSILDSYFISFWKS